MKTVFILLIIYSSSLYSQNNTTISDGGFESLNFFNNGWTYQTRNYVGWGSPISTLIPANPILINPTYLIKDNQNRSEASYIQTIGNDQFITPLNKVFKGNRSLRLGAPSHTQYDSEIISRNVMVTCSKRFLEFYVAIVSETTHDTRFYVTVNGIPVSLEYDGITKMDLAANTMFGSNFYQYYRKWTKVRVNLCQFIGSNVNIAFVNGPCTYNHDMYSYIDEVKMTGYESNLIDTSINVLKDNCELKVDIHSSDSINTVAAIKSLINGFDFIGGFNNPPQIIGNNYSLASYDSSFNFDCKNNLKLYSLKYHAVLDSCGCFSNVSINISTDCSCTPPECPPPTKVNPYLNNLAGNWQANNSYAYNTKRASNDPNQTRKGEIFTSYNSIMNHNGSYWSMDDNAHWISKETNTLIDFNGQSVESTNPLKIPSSAKLAFKNSMTNHVTSNASSQETFFLSNEDNSMFFYPKINQSIGNRDKFDVSEIELPIKPNLSPDWPFISNHWHKNIDRLEQSKDEFHTGVNSLKVLPVNQDTSFAYTQYFTCESQFQTNNGGIIYCHSEPKFNTEFDINKVVFGTINNTSTCGSLTGSQGIAQGTAHKYSNFSKSSVPVPLLNKGQIYNITVDLNKCVTTTRDAFCYVYFDWNQDGDFEDQGERYGLKEVLNNTLTATKPIYIPPYALVGKTRMRVSYQVGAIATNSIYNLPVSNFPCANNLFNSYGEVEDYTINVLDKYEVEASKQTYTITNEDVRINEKSIVNEFSLQKDKDYLLSYWVKDNKTSTAIGYIDVLDNGLAKIVPVYPTRPMNIEGWHKIEKVFRVSTNKFKMVFFPTPNSSTATYFDDIRIQPLDASMKGYVYDELTQRLVSELDENNFATFYDYDEEGQLVRVRKETERGIMTIKESRKSLKQ